jgi:endonuclease/exonuclease/phosphatase family metal-dependent hydrolase
VRVLTWNLFHGRAQPPAGRQLLAEFAGLMAAWEWDLALLQEVPPWWAGPLAHAAAAEYRRALTSRNIGLPLRRALAERWPDAIKSNGGGCNTVLARGGIVAHETARLCRLPERRVAQLVRLADGTCAVNYHGSASSARARGELDALWTRALAFAGDAPLVLGGDLNLREPVAPAGMLHAAQRDVDHVFARGLPASGPAERLDRRIALGPDQVELSDHVPLAVSLRRAG